ncbi:MAG TPA: DUF1206 domain-containing protein [Ktedonobacteraceae bacterium]|nr:DUF1206 domain-containing protein [Ktedonobacteraceae bacterium]
MRPNITVPNEIRGANRTARNAATGKWMTGFARLGYAAKGVVYLIIGFLAAKLATGQGGSATDQRGALHTIYGQPFGKFLLIIVAIGLLAFALWSLIQAIYDTEGKGRDAKGIIGRIGYAAVGIAYAALALGAYQLATGTGNGGQSSTSSTQDWTAKLLKLPFGVPLVVIVGLVVLGIAVYLFAKAYTAKFQRRLGLASLRAQVRKFAIFMGRLGYAALGVVFTIIGIFMIVAAVQFNPQKAKGLDTALGELLSLPFGPVLLGIVALGLIAYGVYSFVEARYRRLGRA